MSRPGPDGARAVIGARVLERLPDLVPQVVSRIRAALDEYQAVPLQDHLDHVLEQETRLVQALIESRSADADDRARAAALGRLRASQGVSVEAVLGAFHVGNSALWDALVEEAGEDVDVLPGLATLMWASLETMSTAITAAHSTVSRSRQVRELTLRQRFLELLALADVGPELVELSVALGFDPGGFFVAAVASIPSDEGSGVLALDETVGSAGPGDRGHSGGAASMSRLGRHVVVVAQGHVGERAVARLRAIPGSRTGMGLIRPGLAGASSSLVDARRSLAITTDSRPVAEFHRDWVAATVVADAERLEPVVTPYRAVIAANPHLVEALECYAEVRGSVTAAARRLHLHPNTVAYRLERWTELTGWDPRTHRGLSDSLLAVALTNVMPASNESD